MQQKILSSSIRVLVSGAASTGTVLTITALPLVAHAQAARLLPAVTVTGKGIENTNEAPTGIARLPDTVKETPKTIFVIPRDVLEQQQVTSLEQALKNVPGITISTGEGNGGQNGDQFRIRGLSAKGDVYLDGLRDFGAYRRDAFNTDSVEVIKGPSGESFGVGNLGGLINQTSKKAGKGNRTSIDQGFGSGPTYRTEVDGNYQLGETTALRVNAMFQEGKVPDRNHVEDDRRGLAVDFGTGLGTPVEWHLNYAYLHRSGPPDYGVPMAEGGDGVYRPITEFDVPGLSRSTSYVRNTDRDNSDAHIVTSLLQAKPGAGLTLNNDTRFSYYDRDFSGTNPAGVNQATLQKLLAGGNAPLRYGARGGMTYMQRGWGLQNVTSIKGEFHTGSLRHRAMAGLDMNHQRDHRDIGTWTGRLNNQTIVNPVFDASQNASVNYRATRNANSTNVGVFLNDRVWLTERISLLGSLRWDYFRSEYETSASAVGGTADAKKLSPAISAIWEPTEDSMFYASFSRAYRPVGTDIALAVGGVQSEVPRNGVSSEPERSDTVEVGAKLDFLDKRLGVTGSVFQIRKSNAYTVDPVSGAIANGFSDTGEGRRIRGVELGLSGRITANWSANLAYAYLDGIVTAAAKPELVDKVAPAVPHYNVTLWTAYDIPHALIPLPGQLTLGGGLQYASGYWANSANTGRVPDTFSLDAMLSYRQGKFRASLNGYNLTNNLNYASAFNASRAVPASGRTVLLSVGMTF